MIALQEELDWQVYSLYNLHSEDLRGPEADVPELALGERACQPAILTLARLVDALSRDGDFVSVAAIYAPRRELAAVVSDLVAEDHVSFLAALRYKPTGLKKRADWEEVWDLQRKEDAAPDEPAKRRIRDSIPIPPKHAQVDFQRTSYWHARGKLDVPKERFISYGQTNTQTPDLYGWAGWDHREQAGYRQQIQGEHGLTDDNLQQWRPAASGRGGRTKKNG